MNRDQIFLHCFGTLGFGWAYWIYGSHWLRKDDRSGREAVWVIGLGGNEELTISLSTFILGLIFVLGRFGHERDSE